MRMAESNIGYAVGFKGSSLDLFDSKGRVIRRFKTTAEIVNAQVSGSGKNATISVTMKDGKFVIYRADGTVVRRG